MSAMKSFMSELARWEGAGDHKTYGEVLRECHAEFVKTYSQMKSPEGKSLLEDILKFITCKIRENSIKYDGTK